MGTQHSGSIKGLGIAITVISALSLVAALFITGATLTAGTLAVLGGSTDSAIVVRGNTEVEPLDLTDLDEDSDIDAGIDEDQSIGDLDVVSTDSADDSTDAAAGLAVAAAVLVPLAVATILKDVVTLVAGIVAIRGAYLPERLGRVFGWTLAGAIVSGLSCNLVTCALCIVTCVFAHKDRAQ